MAEQEIAKHTKNVISLVSNKQHGWRHKLGEVALEIVTIVFAVTLSIWLHSLGEHRHEQEQVRHFLLGLRNDLQTDIAAIGKISQTYHEFDANFTYLSQLDPKAAPDPARFEQAFAMADQNIFFNPLNSRYQGFKSAGKLGNIEDEELMEKLLSLYEQAAKDLQASENGWLFRQNKYRSYVDAALGDSDDSVALQYRVVTAAKGKRLLRDQITERQLYERLNTYAGQAKAIIALIERTYPAYLNKP